MNDRWVKDWNWEGTEAWRRAPCENESKARGGRFRVNSAKEYGLSYDLAGTASACGWPQKMDVGILTLGGTLDVGRIWEVEN